jgi:hypothetical protein
MRQAAAFHSTPHSQNLSHHALQLAELAGTEDRRLHAVLTGSTAFAAVAKASG